MKDHLASFLILFKRLLLSQGQEKDHAAENKHDGQNSFPDRSACSGQANADQHQGNGENAQKRGSLKLLSERCPLLSS